MSARLVRLLGLLARVLGFVVVLGLVVASELNLWLIAVAVSLLVVSFLSNYAQAVLYDRGADLVLPRFRSGEDVVALAWDGPPAQVVACVRGDKNPSVLFQVPLCGKRRTLRLLVRAFDEIAQQQRFHDVELRRPPRP